MFDERYPGYRPTDLAINEMLLVDDYVAAIRAILHQDARFDAGIVDAISITVNKFEKPMQGAEITAYGPGVYVPDQHIYELTVQTAIAEGRPIAVLLGMKSFGDVEKLAEEFHMAVNRRYPLTSPPAYTTAEPFTVSVATRRTLDEFFMVAIEQLKRRLVQHAIASVKTSPAPSGKRAP